MAIRSIANMVDCQYVPVFVGTHDRVSFAGFNTPVANNERNCIFPFILTHEFGLQANSFFGTRLVGSYRFVVGFRYPVMSLVGIFFMILVSFIFILKLSAPALYHKIYTGNLMSNRVAGHTQHGLDAF